MNNVCWLVVTTITRNGSTALPLVIPRSSLTCLRQVKGGMNIARLIMENVSITNELSSRPERSEVEGPAVHSTSTQLNRKPRLVIPSEPAAGEC